MPTIIAVDDLPVMICCPQPELTGRLANLTSNVYKMLISQTPDEAIANIMANTGCAEAEARAYYQAHPPLGKALSNQAATGAVVEAGEARPAPVVAAEVAE